MDLNQFHAVFFEESSEHLQNMEDLLLNLSTDEPDPEELNSIFRAAHSIKGGSGIFGFDALTGITHVMETILDKARNHQLSLTPEIVDTILATCDILTGILQAYQDETEINWSLIESGIENLEAILSNTASEGSDQSVSNDDGFGFFDDDEPTPTAQADDDDGFGFFDDDDTTSTPPAAQASDDDGFGFFDDDETTQSVAEAKSSNNDDKESGDFDDKPTAAATPPAQPYGFYTDNPQSRPMTDEESFGFFTQPNQGAQASTNAKPVAKASSLAPAKAAAPRESSSIRVDTNKIDWVVNLVGEMVITQSMLRLISKEVEGNTSEKLDTAIEELSRNVNEIQEAIMSMRMLPVSFVFNRFPRLVRDLANKLNKKIELVIQGGNTEVDKSMIEKLADPLTHLVRNSLDHGIEPADVRIAAGKPETGTVVLKAEQRGGNILISISDDGGGLNREKILSKARSNGLDVDDNMPDSAVWNLIFSAGFSTAEAVTDVSGRGVGMDVVRKNIEAVKGAIDIESVTGKGSTFTIRLPLTLAIVDGMCVAISEQTLVIPLTNIIESFQPNKTQMKTLKGDTLIHVRDEYWPLVKLHSLLDIENAVEEPDKAIVVLIESNKKRFALLVDSLVGQQQVVIKSLEQHYKKVDCIAGATIMGDGSVALILDIESIASVVKQSDTTETEYV